MKSRVKPAQAILRVLPRLPRRSPTISWRTDAISQLPEMNWTEACVVCIPCLNEERAIGALVRDVRTQLPCVIVVDDGSTDRTRNLAQAAGATVLRHDTPRGKGASLRHAWTWAREAGFTWAITMDGDGQHAPRDLPKFLARAEAAGADLVAGNRMLDARGMPPVRRAVNRWMSRRLARRAGRDLPDSQCGFRLIRLAALDGIQISADNFEIESDVLLGFARAGLRIEFVPIQVIYRGEQSKIHPVRDTIRWFRWLRKTRA